MCLSGVWGGAPEQKIYEYPLVPRRYTNVFDESKINRI